MYFVVEYLDPFVSGRLGFAPSLAQCIRLVAPCQCVGIALDRCGCSDVDLRVAPGCNEKSRLGEWASREKARKCRVPCRRTGRYVKVHKNPWLTARPGRVSDASLTRKTHWAADRRDGPEMATRPNVTNRGLSANPQFICFFPVSRVALAAAGNASFRVFSTATKSLVNSWPPHLPRCVEKRAG